MKEIASTIVETVTTFASEMMAMDEASFTEKKNPGKWSKQEILGHLVDSAQNHIQRFIRAQYEAAPPVIQYDQDQWVRLGNYQQYAKNGLIHFWIAINIHLCHVLFSMDPSQYEKPCGNATDLKTVRFFAEDYLLHLRHHIDQIKNK